jgi:hypothetical protein
MAAADAARHSATDRERADQILCEEGPLTDFELADQFARRGWPIAGQPSAGKRRCDLVRLGRADRLVVDGQTVKRPAPSGSLAIVWKAVA